MMSERPFHWRTLRILFDFSYVTGAKKIYIYVWIVKWIGMQMIQFRLQTVSIDELDD